jgi:DNA-binding transcriptional ArsR family regulator
LLVYYSEDEIDAVFAALADRTRRRVVEELKRGPKPVTGLWDPEAMTLPGFRRHLAALEEAGVIRTEKEGRVRTCSLNAERLAAAEAWIRRMTAFWTDRLDALEDVLDKQESTDEPKP